MVQILINVGEASSLLACAVLVTMLLVPSRMWNRWHR